MIKKLLFLLLAVCMLVVLKPTDAFASSSSVGANIKPGLESGIFIGWDKRFGDMKFGIEWAGMPITHAVADNLFPENVANAPYTDYLTRADLVTIINRAFGAADMAPVSNYSDLIDIKWFAEKVENPPTKATISGFEVKLRKDDLATREEAFVVLARAFKLSGGATNVLDAFSDKGEVSEWAKDETASLVKGKYVQGSKGKLNPKDYITKAEMAQLMYVLVSNYISTPGEKTDNLTGNVMIKVPGVTLKNLTITGDLIIGDGVGDGVVILDGVTVTGRIVVRSTATRVIYLNCPLSSDATLIKHAVVKGILLSVGAPDATLESAIGSIATIADGNAADTTNSYFFYTLFRATDSYGVVKVVKYGAGADTAHFATDAAYANQALSNGDFFIIRVTAGDGTTVLYYKVNVSVPWSPSTNRSGYND